MADWQIHIDGDVSPDRLDAGDLATVLSAWSNAVAFVARRQQLPPEMIGFSAASILPGSVEIPLIFHGQGVPALFIDQVLRWIKARLTEIPYGLRGPISTLREFSARTGLIVWIGSPGGTRAVVEPTDLTTDTRISGRTTIYGQVVRVGGDEPSIRIDTAYGAVTCKNVSLELAQEAAHNLYRDVQMTGDATWDAEKLTLSAFDIEFLEPVVADDTLLSFEQLREQYGSAFAGDSRDILRELRG